MRPNFTNPYEEYHREGFSMGRGQRGCGHQGVGGRGELPLRWEGPNRTGCGSWHLCYHCLTQVLEGGPCNPSASPGAPLNTLRGDPQIPSCFWAWRNSEIHPIFPISSVLGAVNLLLHSEPICFYFWEIPHDLWSSWSIPSYTTALI